MGDPTVKSKSSFSYSGPQETSACRGWRWRRQSSAKAVSFVSSTCYVRSYFFFILSRRRSGWGLLYILTIVPHPEAFDTLCILTTVLCHDVFDALSILSAVLRHESFDFLPILSTVLCHDHKVFNSFSILSGVLCHEACASYLIFILTVTFNSTVTRFLNFFAYLFHFSFHSFW